MPQSLSNPFRGAGLPGATLFPRSDAAAVARLLSLCPAHAVTPLLDHPALARQAGVARVHIKDERGRMGLGSFKALGASFAIANEAARHGAPKDWGAALTGWTFVTASAGNHGMSVAAGARVFGARAVIYLAETVPDVFAERLRAKGATVAREGTNYEDSMAAAATAAARHGWTLLSDSSWPGYSDLPMSVMEGYLQLAAETAAQIDSPPSHILLQAGVGGLAAAVAANARAVWGDDATIVVVEPHAAPALMESIRAARLVTTAGPASNMGRLDCKTPSEIALAGLARDADLFVTITDDEATSGIDTLALHGLETTPSGGAGLAALLCGLPCIGADARVLAILSEGPEDV